MKPRDRILDAAMAVFRRQGFRRSSIEQAAEAAGLTRQALYHHFESREALFRAVIERLHENALAAEIAAANAAETAGGGLADILLAGIGARLRQFIESFDGSPHIEELFSEHLIQARDLYQKYAGLYAAHGAATIARVCARQRLALAGGMTPQELARCVEMAINGAKSMNAGMQPADAFIGDLTVMARTLIAGAVLPKPAKSGAKKTSSKKVPSKKILPKKPVPKKPARQHSGGRK
ncbi:MAG: helix-turn-helix domain-containing protein [Bradyrhizobium sp.]|nr:helix-turn-helix domain-containing protein [Bradyrhizobium sp.]